MHWRWQQRSVTPSRPARPRHDLLRVPPASSALFVCLSSTDANAPDFVNSPRNVPVGSTGTDRVLVTPGSIATHEDISVQRRQMFTH